MDVEHRKLVQEKSCKWFWEEGGLSWESREDSAKGGAERMVLKWSREDSAGGTGSTVFKWSRENCALGAERMVLGRSFLFASNLLSSLKSTSQGSKLCRTGTRDAKTPQGTGEKAWQCLLNSLRCVCVGGVCMFKCMCLCL